MDISMIILTVMLLIVSSFSFVHSMTHLIDSSEEAREVNDWIVEEANRLSTKYNITYDQAIIVVGMD